jgi:hypothetical protein
MSDTQFDIRASIGNMSGTVEEFRVCNAARLLGGRMGQRHSAVMKTVPYRFRRNRRSSSGIHGAKNDKQSLSGK